MMCVLPNKTPAAFNFPCLLAVNIGVNRNILAIVLSAACEILKIL